MAQINFAKGEVQCKIVYYGPAESGKTANLRLIHDRSPERIRGKLTTIATDSNRTLFFDFLPLNLGKVATIRAKLNLYAVPYIDGHDTLRLLVLEGVDGIVFVADARKDRLEANREALANLHDNLAQLGRGPDEVPIVFQANKMDLEGAVSAARLADALGLPDAAAIDANAIDGTGVLPSLKALTKQVLENVAGMMGSAGTGRPAAKKRIAKPVPARVSTPAPKEEEPIFTPAWHRTAPDDPPTVSATDLPAAPAHQPSPAIVHGHSAAHEPSAGLVQGNTPVEPVEPVTDPASASEVLPAPASASASEVLPAAMAEDLRNVALESENAGQWDDGPSTDPNMVASCEDQPFPACGGGMAETAEEPLKRPVHSFPVGEDVANAPEQQMLRRGRAVSVGAGGTRGRVRAKEMPAFGWAIDLNPKRRMESPPIGDRRRRQRPRWRATPPSAKQMTTGAIAALVWIAVTGILVLKLL